jgi:hypothetical protein
MKCSICKNEIELLKDPETGKTVSNNGHSAKPVKTGRCCSRCNEVIVIPMREIKSEKRMKHKSSSKGGVCFICPDCGPFVRVIVEQWSAKADGPNELTFIQHDKRRAIVVDTIELQPTHDKEQRLFNFCVECGMLISHPIDEEFAKQFSIRKILKMKGVRND